MKMHTKRANMPRLCGVDDALQEGILTNEGNQSSGWFSVFSSFGTELKTTIQVGNSNYHDRGSEIIELSPDQACSREQTDLGCSKPLRLNSKPQQ